MAEDDIFHHVRPSEIKIAVFEPQCLRRLQTFIVQWKRRGIGRVQYPELVAGHLSHPGLYLGIFHAFGAHSDLALYSDHLFAPEAVRLYVRITIHLRCEDHLGYARLVSKINEYEPSMVPSSQNLTHKLNFPVERGIRKA